MTLTEAEKHLDAVLAAQRAKGREKYGVGLTHDDGHDWQAEALQEAADCIQYLAAENLRLRSQVAAEREACAKVVEQHIRDWSDNEADGYLEPVLAAIRARQTEGK